MPGVHMGRVYQHLFFLCGRTWFTLPFHLPREGARIGTYLWWKI